MTSTDLWGSQTNSRRAAKNFYPRLIERFCKRKVKVILCRSSPAPFLFQEIKTLPPQKNLWVAMEVNETKSIVYPRFSPPVLIFFLGSEFNLGGLQMERWWLGGVGG